ncbi:hypothetical protein ACFFRR_005054 [Megaselia abdita]
MSISILKRSLAIVDEDETKKKQKKKNNSVKKADNLFDFDEKPVKRKNIMEVRKEILEKSDKANKNVQKLLKLGKTNVETTAAQKLLQRARTGKYVLETEKPEESHQESIFTDEDFAMFEKELVTDV